MSSGEAAEDDGDLEPVTFIRMQAEDTCPVSGEVARRDGLTWLGNFG